MSTLININKNVSNSYAKTRSKLSYTITLENVGSIEANNVIVVDSIPHYLSFIPDSLYGGSNLGIGNHLTIYLGSMAPNSLSTISFDVSVDTIPDTGIIENSASVGYRYTILNTLPNTEVGTNSSNIVQTLIKEAIINEKSFYKLAYPKYVTSGDTLTYEIIIKNIGNVDANNLILKDTIPFGTTLINDSITINTLTIPSISSTEVVQLNIDKLSKEEISTITFKVIVNTTPSANEINNNSIISYTYTIDELNNIYETVNSLSTTATTFFKKAIIDENRGFFKSVNPIYPNPSDTLTYTITLKNTGNTKANNIILKDTIPDGLIYINNSLTINSITIPSANPTSLNGLFVGFLEAGALSTIVYKVNINSLSTGNVFNSKANVKFNYTVDPSIPNSASYNGLSNNAIVRVNIPNINKDNFIQKVNKIYSKTKDTIIYTFTINNTGSTVIFNTILSDTIPKGLEFVDDSIYLNNCVINTFNKDINNKLEINLGTLPALSISTLSFKAIVTTIPLVSNNTLNNDALLQYSYKVDDNADITFSSIINSNKVTTIINEAIIDNTFGEFSINSQPNATIGDEITYKITIKNTGNTKATNIKLINTIPNEVKYIENSLYVDEINLIGVSPENQIRIDYIEPLSIVVLTFKALVQSDNEDGVIENSVIATYDYTLDPNYPNKEKGIGYSNTAVTKLSIATISTNILYEKYIALNEIFNYTFILANTGNTIANNLILLTTIPKGALYIKDSLTINGITKNDISPEGGINLSSLNTSEVTTLSFNVIVSSIPAINPITNSYALTFKYGIYNNGLNVKYGSSLSEVVKTKINAAIISNDYYGFFQTIDRNYIDIGENLIYTISIKNTGNIVAENVILSCSLPKEITYYPDSIKINNVMQPGESLENGINLGIVAVNSLCTISFKTTINEAPPNTKIISNSKVIYDFIFNPDSNIKKTIESISNSTIVTVNYAKISEEDFKQTINSNKISSITYASTKEILTYEISIINSGNVNANNVVFKESIPKELIYIEDSLQINNNISSYKNKDNSIEVNIGTISPNELIKISYKVLTATIPLLNEITTKGLVYFTYKIDESSEEKPPIFIYSNSNVIKINEAIINNEENGFILTSAPNYIMIGDTITYTIVLKNSGNVTAEDVIIIDTLPYGTSLIENSISVIGESPIINTINPNVYTPTLKYSSASSDSLNAFTINNKSTLDFNKVKTLNLNPDTRELSININNISKGSIATATFEVKVNELPINNIIVNSAKVTFKYTKDPNNPKSTNNFEYSNYTKTELVKAIINLDNGFSKKVNKTYSTIDEELIYEISLTNVGSTSANNIIFTETIDDSLLLIEDYIYLNNSTVPNNGDSKNLNISIGTINIGERKNVIFKAKILEVPYYDIVSKASTITYNYTVDSNNPNSILSSGISNIVTTKINYANINENTIIINSSKSVAKLNDIITFTTKVTNLGNIPAKEVVINMKKPPEFEFVKDSIIVKNANLLNYTIDSTIPIGNVNSKDSCEFSFEVLVTKLPMCGEINIDYKLDYYYIVNPKTQEKTLKSLTKTSPNIQVFEAIIDSKRGYFNSYIDKKNIGIGESVVFTSILKNTGNIVATSLSYKNNIPDNLQLINNSASISLDNLNNDEISTITYKIIAVSIPNINPIEILPKVIFNYTPDITSADYALSEGLSNSVLLSIWDANFNPNKGGFILTCDKEQTFIGDIVTFNAYLKNLGNTEANNVLISFEISNNFLFNTDEIKVNNKLCSISLEELSSGFNIGNMLPDEIIILEFKLQVINSSNNLLLTNRGVVNYTFTTDKITQSCRSGNALSKLIEIPIKSAIMNKETGGYKVNVDKKYVEVGGEITIASTLINTGNLPAFNVILSSIIPDGTEFVNNSVIVNNKNIEGAIKKGINIGTLLPNETSIVIYKIKVLSKTSNSIETKNSVKYDFSFENTNSLNANSLKTLATTNGPIISEVSTSNIFSVVIIDGSLEITQKTNLQYAYKGDLISFDIYIKNVGEVLAEDITLKNSISDLFVFNSGSLIINGINMENINPYTSFNIDNLKVGETTKLSFTGVISNALISDPLNISNNLLGAYSYIVDPNAPKIKDDINSTSSSITISGASIENSDGGFILFANTDIVTNDDVLTCTISCTNTGNAIATNSNLNIILQEGLSFIEGSGAINGLSNIFNPITGIKFDLNPNKQVQISFRIRVLQGNNENLFKLNAYITYSFIVNPNESKRTVTNKSNEFILYYKTSRLLLTQSVTQNTVSIKSKVMYSIIARNIGNIKANNVIIKSILPDELNFVIGSLSINKAPQPSANINFGVNIGRLIENQEVIVSFFAEAIKLPSHNIINTLATADYVYSKSEESKKISKNIISNEIEIYISLPIQSKKVIPHNTNGTYHCYNNKHLYNNEYNISGVALPTECMQISKLIKKYKMWSYDTNDLSIDLRDSNVIKIECICGSLKIIKSETVKTANSQGVPNLEGKILTGYEQIINVILICKITYIAKDGRRLYKQCTKLIHSYIILNPVININNLITNGVIKDIWITNMKNGIVSVSALTLLYIASKSDYIQNKNCALYNLNSIEFSNSTLTPNIDKFLTTSDRLWNKFNIPISENIDFNISKITNVDGRINILSIDLIDGSSTTYKSAENLNITGKKLMINILVNVTIKYIEDEKSNIVKNLKGDVYYSTYIIVPNDITKKTKLRIIASIENLYALYEMNNLFTNTTIIIKVTEFLR